MGLEEFRKRCLSLANLVFFSEYRRYVRNCCVVATILCYYRCCQFIASSFDFDFELEECVRKGMNIDNMKYEKQGLRALEQNSGIN